MKKIKVDYVEGGEKWNPLNGENTDDESTEIQ